MGGLQGWQLVIVLAVIVLLFGSRKLPEMARGLGQSLKIFKAETKGLAGSDDEKSDVDQPAIKADDDTTASAGQSEAAKPKDESAKRDS